MDVAFDQENAKAALKMCQENFQGRQLATGHSILVEAGSEIPRLGLSRKTAGLILLSIKDQRCNGSVALFAVRPYLGKFEVHYVRDGQRRDSANSLEELRDGLDVLLEEVDSEQVAEVIAGYRASAATD